MPIAHRLGLNTVFRELQELSFFNHYPRRYEILRENVILTRGNRKAVLERILRETRSALPKCGIVAQVQGRDKTILRYIQPHGVTRMLPSLMFWTSTAFV